MAGLKKNQSIVAICVLLAAVTLGLYWPMTGHKFINIDDQEYITENAHVTPGLTWSGVVWAMRSGYASNWHPLTWVSHMVDCNLYGVNPGGHHFTNLLFHAANTVLLFLLLYQMTGGLWRSALVAALFAWHPLHVESVAWASERKDVLSTCFWLLTMMAYVAYVKRRSRSWYLLAWLLFALGLMSKPMVVTLPFVLLLIDFWPLGRLRLPGFEPVESFSESNGGNTLLASQGDTGPPVSLARLMIEKLPFFALAFVASVVTYLVQKTGGAVSSLEVLPVSTRIANAVLTYLRYLSKTVWPVDLAAIYPYAKHWPVGLVIASVLFLALVSVLFVLRAKRWPYLAMGWFWYLGTLVPTIGLVQVGSQSMADRYMYIPSIGLFMVLAWGLNALWEVWPQKRRVLLAATVAMALVGCLGCTWRQLKYWQDSEKLFLHTVGATTDNYIAYNGLGGALDELGRKDDALVVYTECVRLDPHYPEGQYNLGSALMGEGRLEEAVSHFNAALQDNPRYAQAHNNLGKALLKQGNLEAATAHLSEAVRLKSDFAQAHYNLGTLLLMQSKVDEAMAEFSEALRLKPGYAEAHSNLGIALMGQGKFSEGALHFAEALRLNPANPEAHRNLGFALLEQNKAGEAAQHFSDALRLDPNDAKTHYRLGVALARQHKSSEAIAQFREALRLRPDSADALDELAWMLSSDPNPEFRDGKEAVRLAEQACELTKYQQPDKVATLAAAYAEAGRFPEAVAAAAKARDLASAAGLKEAAARNEGLLKLYQSGRPFRETF